MVDTTGKDGLTIGNAYITREFSIKNNKLRTTAIHNHISGKTLDAEKGSSDFVIRFGGFPGTRLDSRKMKIETINKSSVEADSFVEFIFKPEKVSSSFVTVSMTDTLSANDFFIKRVIRISTDAPTDIVLDSLTVDCFIFDGLIKSWQIPEQAKGCGTPADEMQLGQPVYVDSLFFGCEFPAAFNTIDDCCVKLSYGSGKPLSELCRNGSFSSWPCVCGCASDTDMHSLREGFFKYINTISVPSNFRIQFNSWYDYMYDINDSRLEESFLETDKGCSRFGLRPLDAYVADDGWNDYSGSFWSFNRKFPDELYPAKRAAERLGSSFGLWLGPRGGYGKDVFSFARSIEKAGMGHVNLLGRDICVSSSVYLENLEKLLVDYTKRFDLNYWKLDGFCSTPCRNKKHGHIVGGKNNSFYYTELWERWISIFTNLRKLRYELGKDLWLNITCYANPSPWLLQWVNSVWIQNSNDIGKIEKNDKGIRLGISDKDKLLTYRDDRYYDFYEVRQLQFPARNLYNHEPIYGTTAKISMNTQEFLEYLLMNACRGTAFWELYYSPSMMDDDKWAVNSGVLKWAEKYLPLLAHSSLIGNSPASGEAYGYSCCENGYGIVAIRNPSASNTSFTYCFNEASGVFQVSQQFEAFDVITGKKLGYYSYGSQLLLSLAPNELKVFSFGDCLQLIIPSAPPKPELLPPEAVITGSGSFTLKAFVSADSAGTIYSQGSELSLTVDDSGHFVFTLGSASLISDSTRENTALVTAVREDNGCLKLYCNSKPERSKYLPGVTDIALTGACSTNSTEKKVEIYSGALYYDSV